MINAAMGDENHSRADSNWDALQLFSKPCVRLTRDQRLENNRASKRNYERKRIGIRVRSRYPIALSETDLQRVCAIPAQDIAFQSTRVSNDKMEIMNPMPQAVLSQFSNHPIFHELDHFQQQWLAEACSLNTPHCQTGQMFLAYLQQPLATWSPSEAFIDTFLLFETVPTFDDIIADVHSAERDGSLSLIDTGTANSSGSHVVSAQTILGCIQAVENHTFSTKLHRHFSAFNVPLSKDGTIKCCPKDPPNHVLTKGKLKAKGTDSYNYS